MNPLSLAFIAPRLPSANSVGGAETLLRHLALLAMESGHHVEFLSTCATDHFSWKNDAEQGFRNINGMNVRLFPVDENRDLEKFLTLQELIMKRRNLSRQEEQDWLDNGVNSSAMTEHLNDPSTDYDLVIGGPYLFGLIHSALSKNRVRSILLPCLHDEPFAYLKCFDELFNTVKGAIFNTEPEKQFASSIMNKIPPNSVIGFPIEDFDANPETFKSTLPFKAPYLIYSGRRETMKGTPLLVDYVRTFRERNKIDIRLVFTGKGNIDMERNDSGWIFDAGFLTEETKRSAMAGALAFCHPSTYESLGIVILESWMAGSPCLVHAGSSVLTDQCRRSNGGLWFRCYPDFEEELLMLINNPTLPGRMAENGRNFVKCNYSKEAVKMRLEDFLSRMIAD